MKHQQVAQVIQIQPEIIRFILRQEVLSSHQVFKNPAWFTISPSSVVIPFSGNNNYTVTQNFCITPNGIHPDLEIIIIPIKLARPCFTADYKIVYRNKGNQTISQTNDGISFFYEYTRMNLLSTSEPVSQITAPSGTLIGI